VAEREHRVNDTFMGMAAMLGLAFFLVPSLASAVVASLPLQPGSARSVGGLMLQQLLMGAVVYWHLRVNLQVSFAALGLQRPTAADLRAGLLAGLGLLVVDGACIWCARKAAAMLVGSGRAMAIFYKEQASLMGLFLHERAWLWLAALFLTVTLLAPLAEELFFRGYIYNALQARIGRQAIWVSSLLFAVLHGYLIHGVAIFALAVVLAWLYERYRNLWLNISAHATLNALVAAYLLSQR
jgi:membrane protease YdiL (CAAX protease family)